MRQTQAGGLTWRLYHWARWLWQLLPESIRGGFWGRISPDLKLAYGRQVLARPATVRPDDADAPLVVAGLFSTANGIGEAARATYRALEAAGLSPIAVDLSAHLAPVDMQTDIVCHPMPTDGTGTLILQLNGPETVAALQYLGMLRGRNWYTIGYWAWELPTFPSRWDRAFPFLSEIWTISAFAAGALGQNSDSPRISVFPHAVQPPDNIEHNPLEFGEGDGAILFLAMADSMSSLERKNPIGAIRAFRMAFEGSDRAHLIVKTRNLTRNSLAEADLRKAIGEESNITLLDRSLSETKQWELLNAADCFVSLHRSEGFGLVIAEAMAVGTPVIATDWSGNMDFTSPQTASLIPSKLIPCDDAYGVYTDRQSHWADPDLELAAAAMRRLADDKALRLSQSKRASDSIRQWASAGRIGQAMADHLSAVPIQPTS